MYDMDAQQYCGVSTFNNNYKNLPKAVLSMQARQLMHLDTGQAQ
jgi:hypothetical protein